MSTNDKQRAVSDLFFVALWSAIVITLFVAIFGSKMVGWIAYVPIAFVVVGGVAVVVRKKSD